MKICSFVRSGWEIPHLGVLTRDGNRVIDLTALDTELFSSFSSLVDKGRDQSSLIQSKLDENEDVGKKFDLNEISLKIPFRPEEIWAAGVTYLRSTQAREVETSLKGLYNYVYEAKRPEIFFKSTGFRCVGPDEDVGIRNDSKWSVPEPELTVVLGDNCNVIGCTIGNDMSSRDIEGENPLYLPQAKVFKNCCAIGPVVVTPDELPDPGNLEIDMKIFRKSQVVFHGSISTSQMKRSIEELLTFLRSNNVVPSCSVLMTGTGIVPPDDFSLIDKDIIEIEIEGIGKLRNTARLLSS
jgi:2-dehydro-3-deoxy-D-arabinonate dehydratase